MKEAEIRAYAAIMKEMGLSGLEITEDNRTVRLERTETVVASAEGGQAMKAATVQAYTQTVGQEAVSGMPKAETAGQTAVNEELIVRSPMVGVFYTAPSENAEPYVSVGMQVKRGQTLCIVEAMKLMNELTAERDGVIAEICAVNGQVIEYGTPLFKYAE